MPPKINEKPPHFIHEINSITYDVSDVNLFLPHLNENPPQNAGVTGAPYTTISPLVPKLWYKFVFPTFWLARWKGQAHARYLTLALTEIIHNKSKGYKTHLSTRDVLSATPRASHRHWRTLRFLVFLCVEKYDSHQFRSQGNKEQAD